MLLAALLAAAQTAAAPAPLAAGPDVFGDFQSFCLAHRGDIAAPIAMADAKTWTTVPEAMLASQLPPGVKDAKVRVKIGDGGVEYVFTGTGEFPAPEVGNLHASICFLGSQPGDLSAALAKAATFAKVAPVATQEKSTVYIFTEGAGGHKAIDVQDKAAAAAALKSASASVLIVQSTQGGAGVQLGYAVPTL